MTGLVSIFGRQSPLIPIIFSLTTEHWDTTEHWEDDTEPELYSDSLLRSYPRR